VLSSDDAIEVVGEASDGRAALDQVRAVGPDVVLMDVRMPDLDGISATREVLETSPEVKVMILTTFEQDDYIFGALNAGASGFLLKRTSPEQLIAGIHTVAVGDSLLSPSVTRRVIDRMAQQPAADRPYDERLGELTPREREVLAQVARGLSNTEIADVLFIEESTVKTHVKRILMKLHLRDRVQAVIFAYESGLTRAGSSGRPLTSARSGSAAQIRHARGMGKKGDKRRAKRKRRYPRQPDIEGFQVGPLTVERQGRYITHRVDPEHPDYADFRRAMDEEVAQLPTRLKELREEIRDSLAPFDAFDVVGNLWLLNVPKDRETYRESTEDGKLVIPEIAAAFSA
jgi:DNA-binding NarL/FixJ family response regulator